MLETVQASTSGAWSRPVDVALNAARSWSAHTLDAAGNEALKNTTTTFSVRAADQAGNLSDCAPQTASYRYDNIAPAVSDVQWPSSPTTRRP